MNLSVRLFLAFFIPCFGVTNYALATTYCQRQISCQHLVTCAHPVTTTQIVSCTHYVATPYGTTVAHPSGDLVPITVPMHPGGDFLHSFDVETYACGY